MSAVFGADRDDEVAVRWLVVGGSGSVAVVGAIAYYFSAGVTKGRVWDSTILALLLLMALGIGWFQGGNRIAWIAIWTGLTAAFSGGLLAAHPALVPFDVDSPSIVDVLRLANYPLGAAGVLLFLFRADRRIGARSVLEAAIVVSAGSLLIWVLVVDPLLETTTESGVSLVVSLLYPLADMLLLGVLVVLIVHLSHSPGSLSLVALALAGNLAADVAFSYQNLYDGYEAGGLVDVGWLLCFASLAVAPSWPVAARPEPVGDDGGLNAWRLLFLTAGALLAPAIALAQVAGGHSVDSELLLAALALISLVLVRIVIFNRDLDASRSEVVVLADQLGATNLDLEQARSDQRRLLDRMHRAVEEERSRIAADLHDRPLQHLAGVGYQLERVNVLLRRGDYESAQDLCDRAATELADQLGELRLLMTDIRPPVLDERGLIGALQDQAARMHAEHAGLDVLVEGVGDRVDGDVETALYRVAQEALQNVVRHAAASTVWVRVLSADDRIVMSVSDDGRGMGDTSRTDLLRSGRFGLAGMGERVELLGGSMMIESRWPRGTTISFGLPLSGESTIPGSLSEVCQ